MDDLTLSLETIIDPKLNYPSVEAIVFNTSPPGWNAYITIASARFQYKQVANGPIIDDEIVQMKDLKIHSGESISIFSTKGKCAHIVTIAATAIVPGGDPEIQVVGPKIVTAEPTKCIARCSMNVGQAQTFDLAKPPKAFELDLMLTL
jgi:hypothetical protein